MDKPEQENIFTKNLQFFMRELQLSEAQMERETGIPRKTLSRYYHGEHKPVPENLITLAEFFKITAEDLWKHDFQNTGIDRTRQYARIPDVNEKEFSYFEGQSLYAYYLRENSLTDVYESVIVFDHYFDRRRKYLHGIADTGHHYDVKLVIEDHDSVFIYGIQIEDDRRFFIALHYPSFKIETKYTGGVGILTRLDSDNDFIAQKVILSEERIKLDNQEEKAHLLKILASDFPRVWVSTHIDNMFRSGAWLKD